MFKTQSRVLSLILLLMVTAAIVWYIQNSEESFRALGTLSFLELANILVLSVGSLIVNGLMLRVFLTRFHVHLKFVEWFGLAVVTSLGNYLSPFAAGLVARASYLRARHSFSFAYFGSLIASNYLIIFWMIGVVGIAGLCAIQTWHVPVGLYLLFAFFTVSTSVLAAVPKMRIRGRNTLATGINTVLEGWDIIRSDWALLGSLLLLTLANILINAAIFWLAFRALQQDVPYAESLLVSMLGILSVLINITPGNLGIQEAILGLSAELIGVGGVEGVLAALVVRAAALVVVFTLGPPFSYLLARRLKGS